MRTYDLVRKLRNKQFSSTYGDNIPDISNALVNQIVDKFEEQEQMINTAKRLLVELHKDKQWTTEVEPETELGEWLEAYETL